MRRSRSWTRSRQPCCRLYSWLYVGGMVEGSGPPSLTHSIWKREFALCPKWDRAEDRAVESALQLVVDPVNRLAVDHAERVQRHAHHRYGYGHADDGFAEAGDAALLIADAGGECLVLNLQPHIGAVEVDRHVIGVLNAKLNHHTHL